MLCVSNEKLMKIYSPPKLDLCQGKAKDARHERWKRYTFNYLQVPPKVASEGNSFIEYISSLADTESGRFRGQHG